VIFAAALIAKLLWIDSDWGWVLVGAAAAVDLGETFVFVWWSRRRRARVGAEALLGLEAVVLTRCDPQGQVRVQGEIWGARCPGGADVDERVVVEGIDGLTLVVRRT
jgi:membrane protein implicated in regulation of membrane protease activity